jgi:hypothetical protein
MDGLFIVAKRDCSHPCGKHRQCELSFYNTLHIFFYFPADAGFFVFGDLAIKIPGVFRIHFSLFEMRE